MESAQIYYTYALCDPTKQYDKDVSGFYFMFEPFYIGQGKGGRCFDHLTRYRGCPAKVNKIKSLRSKGIQPVIIKLKENISQEESLNIEVLLIKQLGTKIPILGLPEGPLTNGTSGGSFFNHTEETKAKIGKASKANWENQEYRAAIISSIKITHSDPELKELFKRFAGKNHTTEAKEKIRESKLGKKLSTSHKLAVSNGMKGKTLSDETKSKMSQTLKLSNKPSRYKYWVISSPEGNIFNVECVKLFCQEHSISMAGLQKSFNNSRPAQQGPSKGWQVLEKVLK